MPLRSGTCFLARQLPLLGSRLLFFAARRFSQFAFCSTAILHILLAETSQRLLQAETRFGATVIVMILPDAFFAATYVNFFCDHSRLARTSRASCLPSANRVCILARRACAFCCSSSNWRCLSFRRPDLTSLSERELCSASWARGASLTYAPALLRSCPAE